ncbi:hypothetical protein BT93_H3607 [Corymbia citriodora subsp. variegata]|nr:hypothetical protein BT93_H3607 [Corymbia citriodora subsp. variegata]
MASKFGVAGGIPERRVRPIWDAIDSRQFKNALKQVSSLLGKYPNSPYILSLKALVLERMGKPDEALAICSSAKELLHSNDSALMDDLTLSTLQIVFQRLGHPDLATSCYEHAAAKFPNNLDLMMGLFNCYVRESSFVKQQQTAIKMYKIASEERFLLWAVCSIQLQVLCGNGGEKLLLLAEGLLKKHVATHSLHEPEALMVYISLLEQQDKYGYALEILSGNFGSLLMVEVDKLRIQGRLLARTGDYKAAADVYEKILELCPDDWECLQHYLYCLLEDDPTQGIENKIDAIKLVDCRSSPLTDEVFDSRITRATTFVHKLQENLGNDIVRCPYLAGLEIERRKHLYGKGDEQKLMEDLIQYFFRFGHLACFTSDVEVFVQVLSSDRKVELFKKLMESSSTISQVPAKALGLSITVFKFQQLVGNMHGFTVDGLEDLAVKMVEMFCKNLPLSKDLDPQESMHGEELLSMACNVLIQLFWHTQYFGFILEAIMVLEFGLTIRRHVWQYKILLVHLYSHVGAISLAYEWYKSLEVKNILLETVSHNILPQMLGSPLWMDLNTLLRDYLKFMDDHFKESADLTFLAYRHRNYSKAIEFVQFKERLQNSNQYLLAGIESAILELKQNAGNIDEEERILENLKYGVHFVELSNEIGSKPLTFNEDLESRPWWTPTPEENYLLGPVGEISHIPKDNLMKKQEANARTLIEKKALLPRMIYLSIQSASLSFKDGVEVNGSVSNPIVSSEMKILLEHFAKILGYHLSDALGVLGEVCRDLKSTEVFGVDVINWVNFAVFSNAWKLNSNEFDSQERGAHKFGSWHDVDTLLKKCVLERLKFLSAPISLHVTDFQMLVRLITEPLSWHVLLIQSCVRTSVPSGKKKKKSGSVDPSVLTLSSVVHDSIQSLCGTFEEVMKWLRNQIRRLECKEENLEGILLSMRNEVQKGRPGGAFQILETMCSSGSKELGDRISGALKSWDSNHLVRKIVSGQRAVLSETLSICESKCRTLNTLKKQISQI